MIWKLISDSLMITRHFEKEIILNVPLELTNNKKSKLDRKESLGTVQWLEVTHNDSRLCSMNHMSHDSFYVMSTFYIMMT